MSSLEYSLSLYQPSSSKTNLESSFQLLSLSFPELLSLSIPLFAPSSNDQISSLQEILLLGAA
jgi:hypothetical protein